MKAQFQGIALKISFIFDHTLFLPGVFWASNGFQDLSVQVFDRGHSRRF